MTILPRHLILGLSLLLTTPALFAEVVNINKADSATLQQHLKGIGPVKSEAIVDYRKKHGSFKSLDDLLKVQGVGPSLLEKNKKNLSVNRGVSKTSTTQKPAAKKEQTQRSSVEQGSKGTATEEKQPSKKHSKETTKKNKSADTKKDDSKTKKASTSEKSTKSEKKPKKSSTRRQTASDSKEKK
jgi:competence protein ComEA